MNTGYVLQQGLNALPLGAVYGLFAAAYVLIHAVTRRLNLVFGSLAVWAGYTTINVTVLAMLAHPGALLGPLAAGASLGVAHAVLLGGVLERTTMRPLYREPSLALLVTTLGAALVVEEVLRVANDSRERWLPPVFADAVAALPVGDFIVRLGGMQAAVMLAALGLALALTWVMAHHPFGRVWRAVADDPAMASLCGVDVGWVIGRTFLAASLLAGTAGVMVALSYGVASYYGAFAIGLKTLFVAVVGGLGSLRGAVIAGFALPVFEVAWSAAFGLAYRDAAAFALLTLAMIACPRGIGGEDGDSDRP